MGRLYREWADVYVESADGYIPTGASELELATSGLELANSSADSSTDSSADPLKIGVWVRGFSGTQRAGNTNYPDLSRRSL